MRRGRHARDAGGWRGTWRIRTEPQRTSDEYAVWLLSLLTHAGLRKDEISAAVIGTVVPAALYHLRRLCRDWFDVEPLIARATLDWGFEIRVDNPDEVGADRLLNALAGAPPLRRPADRGAISAPRPRSTWWTRMAPISAA